MFRPPSLMPSSSPAPAAAPPRNDGDGFSTTRMSESRLGPRRPFSLSRIGFISAAVGRKPFRMSWSFFSRPSATIRATAASAPGQSEISKSAATGPMLAQQFLYSVCVAAENKVGQVLLSGLDHGQDGAVVLGAGDAGRDVFYASGLTDQLLKTGDHDVLLLLRAAGCDRCAMLRA